MSTAPPLALPADAAGWTTFLHDRCGNQLAVARDQLNRVTAMAGAEPVAVLEEWNRLHTALSNAAAVSSLISQVHPDVAIREVAEAYERDAEKLSSELTLNRQLYEVFASWPEAEQGLDEQAARLLRLTRRDFRRAGVDRDDATRARLQELAERETELSQQYSRAVRDDVRTIRIAAERLDGLPADFVAGHPADEEGLVTVTTDYPDSVPFRTFARDAGARRELTIQFLNRGWPGNDVRLQELLAVRHERAAILGYANWADYDAEVKMIGSGSAIGEFIDRIAETAERSAWADYRRLLERVRQDRPGATMIDAADSAYYTELVRREQFGVDAQEARRFFPADRVRDGLLDVTGQLFGLRYDPVPDAPAWHPDVAVYDVHRADDGAHDDAGARSEDSRLGRIYLDLHPREGKYKHAAQFDLVPGITGHQLPEGALVCNFPKGLMEHDHVVTLFHEFGHLVHHILGGRQRWQRFSGVATEWDFVEAPSQMLEEWAWNAEVLRRFAIDDVGSPIPEELVARMRAADRFGQGLYIRTQSFYAALSYATHRGPVEDMTALEKELQGRYSLLAFLPGTHFHASFEHLVGYSSAYYTYLWSFVIAQDLFSAFEPGDLFAAGPANRYRDLILARGGSKDAADLVTDFLGRPYRFDAYQAWLDASASTSDRPAGDSS